MAGRKGRSGRPRIPSAVKKARGTYRKDRAGANGRGPEVTFPVVSLEPPAFLDKYGLEEWNRIVPLLDSVKVLTAPDLQALASYCVNVSIATRAAEHVNKNGLMSPVMKGSRMTRVNPHIKIGHDARAQMKSFAIEFGLTPAARSRIVSGVPGDDKPKKEDEASEDFLFHPPVRLVVNNKKGK